MDNKLVTLRKNSEVERNRTQVILFIANINFRQK